jgi:hypothetical protein
MTARPVRQTIGFGFDPGESPYHFAVVIARAEREAVRIEERFVWGDEEGAVEDPRPAVVKAELTRARWERIAMAAKNELNRSLRRAGRRAGELRAGETLLAPHLGKELTLLAWAVENAAADPEDGTISRMVSNWLGLVPEERWWLYATVNASLELPEHGPERGWRKAIKVAFAENPIQGALPPPEPRARERGVAGARPRRRPGQSQLALPIDGRQLLMEESE